MCPFVWFLDISTLPHRVQWYRFYSIVLLLGLFEWFLDMTSLPPFSSMTLHVAPGDGFFGTQRTVKLIFHSMNPHVALSVVCGCMVFAIDTTNNNLITMNNTSHCIGRFSMLHFMLPSSHFFLSFRYCFHKPDCNNQNGNVWSPY